MWEHTLVTTTDVSAERLWSVIADVANWPDWHPDADAVRVSGGAYRVKRGGRWGRLKTEVSVAPHRFVVSYPLLFARARTTFRFAPRAGATGVRLSVQLVGPGAFLYQDAADEDWPDTVSELFKCLVERARVVAEPKGGPAAVLEFTR